MTYQRTNRLTWVGARDACASKKERISKSLSRVSQSQYKLEAVSSQQKPVESHQRFIRESVEENRESVERRRKKRETIKISRKSLKVRRSQKMSIVVNAGLLDLSIFALIIALSVVLIIGLVARTCQIYLYTRQLMLVEEEEKVECFIGIT